jgi:hypothetical protein
MLQFKLPTNLHQNIIHYDVKQKPAAKNQVSVVNAQNRKPTKKPDFPFGVPTDIIPESIVSKKNLLDALTKINRSTLENRYQAFTRMNDDKKEVYALVYYYENCWYAAWLPPIGKESEYVYGYSSVHKDTATTRNKVSRTVSGRESECKKVKYARSHYFLFSKTVTQQDIMNGDSARHWTTDAGVMRWQKKGKRMYVNAIMKFNATLATHIPTWKEDIDNNVFSRIQNKSALQVMAPTWLTSDPSCEKVLSYDSLLTIAKNEDLVYKWSLTKIIEKVLGIIETPYFRKYIQSTCDQMEQMFHSPEVTSISGIREICECLERYLNNIEAIRSIWPNCPVDYFQKYEKILSQLCLFNYTYLREQSKSWLNTHMPVASFFNILEKESTDSNEAFYFYELRDTLLMLNTLLTYKADLTPPKRWRINDFHDYVQSESWKFNNPNESLPQDLFPTPIKLEIQNQNWTFFQPIDTHQLGQWGQAVRNCVGNSSVYANGVRTKQHFIVLCMIDKKPIFTIQLKVCDGVMSVQQIQRVCSRSLTEDDKASYTKAFSEALNLREQQLTQSPE